MKLLCIAKRAVPFLLGFAVGVVPAWVFSPVSEVSPVAYESSTSNWKSYCKPGKNKSKAYRSSVETPLAVLSKPKPTYTDVARRDKVEGTVKVRVEFKADGTIGEVAAISELPGGLTEQAENAARQIKFRPAAVDGVAVDSSKLIEYTFAIY